MNSFTFRLNTFVEHCQALALERDKQYENSYAVGIRTTVEASAGGAVYVKLFWRSGSSCSIGALVRKEDGAVLYPAGLKGPFIAKADKGRVPAEQSPATVRGSIYDTRTWAACVGPYGVKTLDRR